MTTSGRTLSLTIPARSMWTALRVVSALCLVACASAQAPVLPQCAQGCANAAAVQVGCSLSNPSCLCKTSFTPNVVACSKTASCSASEQSVVSAVLQTMCAAGAFPPPCHRVDCHPVGQSRVLPRAPHQARDRLLPVPPRLSVRPPCR
ncbi:hypothetical protein B0H12DRAFT_1108063 [Mycena haematopus]|nr:hypothetical protein B0H12DRAFT_1108063 [Mycena haematopus]